MGRFRNRLKPSKGKRWGKGLSSSSNPQTNKFRELARRGLFLPAESKARGESLLTSAALKLHNASSMTSLSTESMEDDTQSTTNTFDSYASMFSACSNQSFNRLFRSFRPDSSLHKDMLAVLAAVTEVIKNNGGTESDTEYFAALIVAMEGMEDEALITAAASLLGMGMKRLHPSVLIEKFPESTKLFMSLLEHWAPQGEPSLLKSLIGCLSHVLRAQDISRWKEESTMHCFNAILGCCIHPKPKLRQASHHAVCAILRGSRFMLVDKDTPGHHPAAANTAQHLVKQIESLGVNSNEAVTSTLHILGLLKEILPCFPKNSVKSVCESILKVIKFGNVLTFTCGLKAIHSLVLASPDESTLPAEINAQLITALQDYRPALHDPQPLTAWITTVEQAVTNLYRLNPSLGTPHLLNLCNTCKELWLSDREEVHIAAAKTFQNLLRKCCGDAECAAKAFTHLEQSLHYQYHPAWPHVFTTIGCFFKVVKHNTASYSGNCLKTLTELRSTPDFCYTKELDATLGHAVAALGPKYILQTTPLLISGDLSDDLSFPRSWLLPVLRDNVRNTELKFFQTYFMPLAINCQKRAENEGIDSTVGRTYLLLYRQIWSIFPAFCSQPTDIKTCFKNMAKFLGENLMGDKEVSKYIMTGIRALIKSSLSNSEDNIVLTGYSKNFLPRLFVKFTNEDHNPAVLETIRTYVQIADEQFIQKLLSVALEKFTTAEKETQPLIRELMLDLIVTLIPYVNIQGLEDIYREIQPILNNNKEKKLQKRAHRIISCICEQKQSTACVEFMRHRIHELKSLLLSTQADKAARLISLTSICENFDFEVKELIDLIVPEALQSIRDSNQKTKLNSMKLLVICAKRIQILSDEGSFNVFLEAILSGSNNSPETSSAALIAISHLLHNFTGMFPAVMLKSLLESASTALTSSNRELVDSAMKFINIFILSCPPAVVKPQLTSVITGLCSMSEENKNHFRNDIRDLLCRLIRKFGHDFVRTLIPQDEVIFLKRLKNIKKTESRKIKKRKTTEHRSQTDESFVETSKAKSIEDLLADSDEEPQEEKEPEKATKLSSWIQEGPGEIVDLLDSKVTQKLSSNKPTSSISKSVTPVTIGEDGKIIIKPHKDDDRDDDGDVDDMDVMGDETQINKPTTSKNTYKAGGRGIHRAVGEEYKSKKAGGDVKKKGKPDPYAYIKLNPAQLNRRKRAKLSGQFKGVVRGARNGALKGNKLKRRKTKRPL